MELLTTNNKICFTIQCLIVDKKTGRILHKFGRMFTSPNYDNQLMEIKMHPSYTWRYIGKKNKNYNYLLYRRCHIPIMLFGETDVYFINEIPKAMVQCSEEGQKRGLGKWKHLPRTTLRYIKLSCVMMQIKHTDLY